jgi:hypothetical protein
MQVWPVRYRAGRQEGGDVVTAGLVVLIALATVLGTLGAWTLGFIDGASKAFRDGRDQGYRDGLRFREWHPPLPPTGKPELRIIHGGGWKGAA